MMTTNTLIRWLSICVVGFYSTLRNIDARHYTSISHRQAVALFLNDKGPYLDTAEVRDKAFDEEGDYILCSPNILSFLNSSVQKEQIISKCCGHLQDCASFVPPWKTKFGLKNDAKYKMLECTCVGMFRSCVGDADDKDVRKIGKLYFNKIKPRCLLKLYRPYCDRSFYDEQNKTYSNNDNEKYFCAGYYLNKEL